MGGEPPTYRGGGEPEAQPRAETGFAEKPKDQGVVQNGQPPDRHEGKRTNAVAAGVNAGAVLEEVERLAEQVQRPVTGDKAQEPGRLCQVWNEVGWLPGTGLGYAPDPGIDPGSGTGIEPTIKNKNGDLPDLNYSQLEHRAHEAVPRVHTVDTHPGVFGPDHSPRWRLVARTPCKGGKMAALTTATGSALPQQQSPRDAATPSGCGGPLAKRASRTRKGEHHANTLRSQHASVWRKDQERAAMSESGDGERSMSYARRDVNWTLSSFGDARTSLDMASSRGHWEHAGLRGEWC